MFTLKSNYDVKPIYSLRIKFNIHFDFCYLFFITLVYSCSKIAQVFVLVLS